MNRRLCTVSLLITLLGGGALGAAPAKVAPVLELPAALAAARDAQAKANARRALRTAVAAYRRALRAGQSIGGGADLWAVMSCRVSPLPRPLAPWMLQLRNPWAGVAGSPPSACAQMILDLANPDQETARAMASPGNLGQVQLGLCMRDPGTGRMASIHAVVFLHDALPGPGLRHEYSVATTIDESAKDRAVRALAIRIHAQLRKRFRRARAAGLPLMSGTDFQASVFGRDPDRTEVPDYWNRQNPWRMGTPAINPTVADVSSSEELDTWNWVGSQLGEIQIGYAAPTPTSPAAIATAVHLFQPFPDGKGRSTHLFTKVSRIP